jgi:hypothetical protein
MISQDFILLILNCKSYKDRAILQRKLWVNNLPYEIKHFYVIGDETLIDEHMFMDDVLYVKCKDDYASLPTKNYEHYALDEYWKKLQDDEGVYACVPRMGKQRISLSSIENRIVDYKGFCYGIIISDELNPSDINLPFQYRIVKKDTNIKEEIEKVFTMYSNVDYLFFTYNYSEIKLDDIMNYFKLFTLHNLPYISFDNSFYISKVCLYTLYDEDFNFQDLHSIKEHQNILE